jgi:tetratricopeptide (TPR) repeat protein
MLTPEFAVSGPRVDHAATLDSLNVWTEAGKYALVDSISTTELVHIEQQVGVDSPEAAQVINALVLARVLNGRAIEDETLALARKSVRINSEHQIGHAADLALSLKHLGLVLTKRQEFDEARVQLERALTLYETEVGSTSVEVGSTLGKLGDLLNDIGDLPAARQVMRRNLDISVEQRGLGHKELAGKYYNYARLLVRLGEYEDAETTYELSREIVRKEYGSRPVLMAYVMNGLGILYDEMGDYPRARDHYDQALSIAKEALGDEHTFVASCLNNLGYLYRNLGSYDEATSFYRRSLAVYRAAGLSRHSHTANTLSNLAEVYGLKGENERARGIHFDALSIREEVLGETHAQVALSLDRIAASYRESGDVSSARETVERAVAIRRQVQGDSHPDVALSLSELSLVEESGGNLHEAAKHLLATIEIQEGALGGDHVYLAESLNRLAQVNLKLGRPEVTLSLALRAEEISRRNARLATGSLPERLALRLAAVRDSGLGLATVAAARIGGSTAAQDVWTSMVRSRSLVLDEMAVRHRTVFAARNPEVEQLREDFDRASRHLANLLVRGVGDDPDRYSEQVTRAREERERLEFALADRSQDDRPNESGADPDLSDIRRALPPHGVLVSCLFLEAAGEKGAYAIAARRDGEVELVPLGATSEIERAIVDWRTDMQRGPRRAAQADIEVEAESRI